MYMRGKYIYRWGPTYFGYMYGVSHQVLITKWTLCIM